MLTLAKVVFDNHKLNKAGTINVNIAKYCLVPSIQIYRRLRCKQLSRREIGHDTSECPELTSVIRES